MTCANCGKQSPEESTFCAFCGTPLASGRSMSEPTPSPQSTMAQVLAATEYGSFGARLGAFLIDTIVVNMAGAVVTIPVAVVLALVLPALGVSESLIEDIGALAGFLISITIYLVYEAGMLSSLRQATLGKQALGLFVTDLNGGRISFARGAGRSLARFVSAMTLLVGYFIQPFTAKRQTLHDILAGTLVVKRRK